MTGVGAASLLAQQPVDPDKVYAGPVGLLIVLVMIVATVFLIRNMNRRLKRLPPEFAAPDEQVSDTEPGRGGLPPQGGPPAQEQTEPPPR